MAENTVNDEENKSKFSIFSTRGRRSTKVRGWFRASKHQKTDLLGFEEVYSVAVEAKNKLWSLHREPCWTERNSVKNFCWGKNKQENRSHAKCLDWYTSCYSPYNYWTTISRSINILKDVEFTQANKMFEVVCKSCYKRRNPKPQHKNPIEAGDMEKLNSYFSNDCPDKLQEFVWFNLCYYLGRRRREGWRELSKELARVQVQKNKGWKFLKKLWCCVGGGNKVIWLYQLSWKCKLAIVTS